MPITASSARANSIAHPGIFPHNQEAQNWSVKKWLKFDWRAGWGTSEFEDKVAEGEIKVKFPKAWADSVDREDAGEVVEQNLAKLEERYKLRQQVLENGTQIDGPHIKGKPRVGRDLDFSYMITNLNSGHNLPSGSLGAQPQLWVNVALIDPDGKNIWESGYVDKNGDIADLHSLEVAAGRLKSDKQIVHFQTKFLTTNVKGTDREMYLPVNFDVDPLPHLRPPQVPTTVLNHPPLVRMEARSLPPHGEKKAAYSVPGHLIKKPGKYRLAFRMRSRAEPIYFMRFVGSTKEMEAAYERADDELPCPRGGGRSGALAREPRALDCGPARGSDQRVRSPSKAFCKPSDPSGQSHEDCRRV